MMALSEKLSLPADTYLPYLDLVATAIAADIVPITGENRTLTFYGLRQVNESPNNGYGHSCSWQVSANRYLSITSFL